MNDVINIFGDSSSTSSSEGRFYDGKTWTNVCPEINDPSSLGSPPKDKKKISLSRFFRSSPSSKKDKTPVPPILDGDGKILVTIPSFRYGQRCGETLIELFANAKNPDNIVISLIEQNSENADDPFCLEVYCELASASNGNKKNDGKIYKRNTIRKDTIKVITNEKEREQCPRSNQIRVVRLHDLGAKGSSWARALGRKVLGNEEFCLQTAAHSSFVEHWDEKVLKEWLGTQNEYGIISYPPKLGTLNDVSLAEQLTVPRNCGVAILEKEKIPHYNPKGDGKVERLKKPLLAHTWAPGFSFAKCHLEESAPYDGFTPFVSSDVESFARFARFWTRGYDVYTPTQNIVFRKQEGKPNVHKMEWFNKWKGRKERSRELSLRRIHSFLQILGEGEVGVKLDNLGIYGLGKRRTLKQLNEFVGIDLDTQQPRPENLPCGNFRWVPYDSSISPIENLYSNPDDLEPQPEYPLRTELTFAKDYEVSSLDFNAFAGDLFHPSTQKDSAATASSPSQPLNDIPYGKFFILWVLGLMLWRHAYVFLSTNTSGSKRRNARGRGKNNSSKNR